MFCKSVIKSGNVIILLLSLLSSIHLSEAAGDTFNSHTNDCLCERSQPLCPLYSAMAPLGVKDLGFSHGDFAPRTNGTFVKPAQSLPFVLRGDFITKL